MQNVENVESLEFEFVIFNAAMLKRSEVRARNRASVVIYRSFTGKFN